MHKPLVLSLAALTLFATCRAPDEHAGPRQVEPDQVAEPATPHWIWVAGEPGQDQRVILAREFDIGGAASAARLQGSCDNGFEVRLNGTRVLWGEEWSRPVFADVTRQLRVGTNRLTVQAHNQGGPAGLQLELSWRDARGVERRLVSDAGWRAAEIPGTGWSESDLDLELLPAALELGALGVEPWGDLAAAQPLPRDGALQADEVQVAEGYAVEMLYSVPRAGQGSWVALTFDPRGRALVSAERGGLYRVTLAGAAGGEARVELLDDTLGGAQGLLAEGGDIYAVCNPRGDLPAGLWRLRDADGDDVYESRELLLELRGSGEHGPHAVLAQGERLLLLAGNHTELPENIVRSRVPLSWGEDQLLPAREDPNGHAWGVPAPGGWVLSLDREGGDLELLAAGMRNTYDIALGPEDELFGYDSDMEWDVGLPWYRAPRALHLVSGADFGWRRGSGKWPAAWPDTLPSLVDTDLSSPVGVLHGAGLSAFQARDRAALFLGDWAYGRVLAVDLEPRGASWSGRVRPFLSGTPLPVTDLAAGPDGCLYVTIGGRNTQSGLYRVRPLAAQALAAPASWPGRATRDRRRALEALHLQPDAQALARIWPALASDDPFLRHAARVALEGLPAELWIERGRSESNPAALAQAVIALAHAGDRLRAAEAADWVARAPLEQLDDGALIDMLRALALVELRLDGVPAPQRQLLRARLEDVYPRGRDAVDRELCRLLVALDSERVVALTLPRIEQASDDQQALFLAFQLVEARAGWDADSRARFLALVDGAPDQLTGGNSLLGYLAGLRSDAHARLGDGAPGDAVVAAAPAAVRPFVYDWQVGDLADAGAELEHGRDFQRGRALFREATCFSCHRVRGEGGGTGPDLTGAGSRFSTRDLLEAVLEPSAVVSDQYREMELLTTDDELLVGRAVADRGGAVRLLKLPPDERVIEVPRDEVLELRPHPFSRMPEGLVDGLEREELLDLLAWLRAGGDPRDPAFRAVEAE